MVRIAEILVGNWVRRESSRPWHKAQSIFIDEVLTKCGRFMSRWDKKNNELQARLEGSIITEDVCKSCFNL